MLAITQPNKINNLHVVKTSPLRIYSMIYVLGETVYILETTEIIKVS